MRLEEDKLIKSSLRNIYILLLQKTLEDFTHSCYQRHVDRLEGNSNRSPVRAPRDTRRLFIESRAHFHPIGILFGLYSTRGLNAPPPNVLTLIITKTLFFTDMFKQTMYIVLIN